MSLSKSIEEVLFIEVQSQLSQQLLLAKMAVRRKCSSQ